MTTGVFLQLGKSYAQSAQNAFYFIRQVHWLWKPVVLLVAALYSVILLPLGLVFSLLVVLDWLGFIVDSIRDKLLDMMDTQSWAVDDSLAEFLLRPVALVLLAPLFLLSILIPKVSSAAMTDSPIGQPSSLAGNTGEGSFRRVNAIMWRAAGRLFTYTANAPLLLKPFAALVAVVYSLVLILVGAIFGLLIPLDWVSQLIESIRQGIVRFVDNQQYKIRYSAGGFVFVPMLLIVLAPLFLATLLIPKFTSQLDGNT